MRDSRKLGAIVFLVALAVRVAHLLSSRADPTFDAPVVDAQTYDGLARALATGGPLTDQFFWQAPFYPAFLALVYRLAGPSILVAKLLQAAAGALSATLTFRLGLAVFGRGAALLAAASVALYGPLVFFEGELLSTGFETLEALILILLFMRLARPARRGLWLVAGAAGAVAVLTRATFLPFVVASLLAAALAADRRGALARLLLAAAGFALVGLPVAFASHAATGRFSMLPASGGLNLYIGNNPEADRTVAIRPGWDWKELTRLPHRHGVTEKRNTGRFFLGLVADWVLRDPLAFLRGELDKTVQFACSRELPRNTDLYVFREWCPVLRPLAWKVGRFGFPFGVLLPLAAAGLVLGAWRLPAPLALFLLLYPLAVIAVFVSARYRAPVVPALALVAAQGTIGLVREATARRWGRLSMALAAAALSLGIATAGPFTQEAADYRAELDYFLGTRALDAGELEAARALFERALVRQPNHGDVHNQLGLVYIRLRDLDRALAEFRLALDANPRSVIARTNLGRVLAARGRVAEAIRELATAVEQDPYDLDARFELGLALLAAGRGKAAAAELSLVVEARPGDARARAELERALRLP